MNSKILSQGPRVAEFIGKFCRHTKGPLTGQRIELRDWQTGILDELYRLRDDGHRRYRRGLLGIPRKNGKSNLGAGIGLYGLVADGEPGAEVYSCAGTRDQARIVFGMARRMVELDPQLSGSLKVYRDVIEHPGSGSLYRVLAAEAFAAEGLNPSTVVFDELHVQPNDDLWNVMNLGSGTRTQPLILGITTAGVKSDPRGQDSIAYRLYQYGRRLEAGEESDDAFYFHWIEPADKDCDWRDPKIWAEANPALGDFLHLEDFESAAKLTPENEFRTKRLNQWTSSTQAWLPYGAWDACSSPRKVKDGDEIVLGFDGSYSGDSTALVGCTLDGHVFVVDNWEAPIEEAGGWRVDIAQVEAAITQACRRWQVREVACDPYRWQRSMQALEDEGLPIVEYPTGSPARMVPACATFYDAVMDETLTHDGDPRLSRHVGNAVLKVDQRGPRIVKDTKSSPRKIDLAVCAVIAYERAAFYRQEPSAAPLVTFR